MFFTNEVSSLTKRNAERAGLSHFSSQGRGLILRELKFRQYQGCYYDVRCICLLDESLVPDTISVDDKSISHDLLNSLPKVLGIFEVQSGSGIHLRLV